MRERASCLWFVVGGWLALLETSRAFSFSYTAPTSCNPLNVTWQGGNAPFYMFITPPSGTPRNISIPDEAYDGTSGAFSTTLELAAGRNFILTMSDVTGFGTGGNSDILTVGGGSSGCNITDPSSGFSFKLASGIQQCGVYSISDYGGATQPVHAEGLIPVGSAFTVNIPNGDTSYNWTVNMASGTRFLMFMQDAEGRLSTVTETQQVGGSNNSSCLDSNSPASTLSSVTQEPTANPTATANPTPSGSHGGNNNKAAIIGGSVAGGIGFLVLVVLLVWWLARRRQDPMDKYAKKRRKKGMDGLGTLDLASSTPNLPATSPNQLPPFEFEPQPFILPHPANNRVENVPLSPTTHYGSSNDRAATQVHTPRSPSDSTRPSSSNKAAMAGAEGLQPQRRFVLHTDAGSVANLSTVELPPTYNAAAGGGEPTAGAAIPSPSPSPPPPEHNLAPPTAPEPGLLQGNTPSEGPTPPSQNHSTGEQSSDAHLQ